MKYDFTQLNTTKLYTQYPSGFGIGAVENV